MSANQNETFFLNRGRAHGESGEWTSAIADLELADQIANENIRQHGGGGAVNEAYDVSVDIEQMLGVFRVALELSNRGLDVRLTSPITFSTRRNAAIHVRDKNNTWSADVRVKSRVWLIDDIDAEWLRPDHWYVFLDNQDNPYSACIDSCIRITPEPLQKGSGICWLPANLQEQERVRRQWQEFGKHEMGAD